MSERWVQHRSGQGEKWKVLGYGLDFWRCWNPEGEDEFVLPKSEFPECAAPEVWTECTREVAEVTGDGTLYIHRVAILSCCKKDERWSWRGDALVIERRQR